MGHRHRFFPLVLALAPFLPDSLFAAPIQYRLPRETAVLKPGAGAELASAQCGLCHSADYITTQPPSRGVMFWQASVTKMIRVYGAEISEAQAAEITAYLALHY